MGIPGRGFSREEDQALLPEKPGGQEMVARPGLARGRALRRQWWLEAAGGSVRRAGCSRPGRLLSAGQSHQGTLRHLKPQWSPSEDNVTGSSLLKPKRQPRQETPTGGPLRLRLPGTARSPAARGLAEEAGQRGEHPRPEEAGGPQPHCPGAAVLKGEQS